jgi:ABC-type amino acid transport substrate-binding protein
MRKVLPAIAAAFFLLSCVPYAFSADTQIRVGVYHNAPLTVIEDDGSIRGFFVDVLEHIAHKEGWEIEYVPDSWSQCLKNLKNGDIDLLGVIAYSEERNNVFEFTYEAVLSEWAQVYTYDESGIDSIVDLQGKKVAVLQGDSHYTNLKNLVNQFGINVRFIEAFEYEVSE